MNVQRSKIKSKIDKAKHYMPEIVVGLCLIGGIVAIPLIKKAMNPSELLIAIDPEQADNILVLEQLTVDTFRDLDYDEYYHVTPIPK
jgi:hypothetical protein